MLWLSRCIGRLVQGWPAPDRRTAEPPFALDAVCRCLPHRHSSDPVWCIS